MTPEDRQRLLDMKIDPDFLQTFRGAFKTKNGRMPTRDEETKAVDLYMLDAYRKAETYVPTPKPVVAKKSAFVGMGLTTREDERRLAKSAEQEITLTKAQREEQRLLTMMADPIAMAAHKKRYDLGDEQAMRDMVKMWDLYCAGARTWDFVNKRLTTKAAMDANNEAFRKRALVEAVAAKSKSATETAAEIAVTRKRKVKRTVEYGPDGAIIGSVETEIDA